MIIIDWKDSKITHRFRGHRAIVTDVRFHPDESKLIVFSSSQDGSVRGWDLVMNSDLLTFQASTHHITDF